MKRTLIASLFISASLSAFAQKKKSSEEQKPLCVIELFSSENCGSCPLGERTLATLEGKNMPVQVIPLVYHVTNWDNALWSDPYAKAAFDSLHNVYSGKLASEKLLPQAFIQGKTSEVGFENTEIQRKMSEMNWKMDTLKFDISAKLSTDSSSIKISSTISNLPKAYANYQISINYVAIESYQPVGNGINRGRLLHHYYPVLDYVRTMVKSSNEATLSVKRKNLVPGSFVVIYIQNPQTLEIVAVRKVMVNA